MIRNFCGGPEDDGQVSDREGHTLKQQGKKGIIKIKIIIDNQDDSKIWWL